MRCLAMVAVLSICACASTTSSRPTASNKSMDARSCASPYVPAVADANASVFERPDSTSSVVGSLSRRMGVCAGTTTVGFGFRRVKLPNGTEGYVPETALSDS